MERRNREFWRAQVASWRASGLTAPEFARRENLVLGTLRGWAWKLGRVESSGVIELISARPTARVSVEIVVGEIAIRLEDASAELIGAVVRELRQC